MRVRVLAGLGLAALLAGCSQPTTGTAAPVQQGPNVGDPLDAERFGTDRCALLTGAQATNLGFETPGHQEPGVAPTGSYPTCSWQSKDTDALHVGFLPASTDGLAGLYKRKDEFEYFEPTWLRGRPAVFTDQFDYREHGQCGIAVGISDRLTLYVKIVYFDPMPTPCETTERAANAVIRTIEEDS